MSSIDFIKIPLWVLSTVGLKMPESSNSNDVYQINAKWIFPIALCNTIVHLIGQFNGAMLKIQMGYDLSIVGHYIFPLFYIGSVVPKVASVLLKRYELNELLLELDDILPRTMEQQFDYKLKARLNYVTRLAIVYAIIQILSLQYISWSSTFIEYFGGRGENETFQIPLPYGDEYPFYRHHPVSYVLMFASQCWEAYVCAAIIYAVNFFLCGIISQIHMHYEHLIRKLSAYNETDSQEKEREHLIWCITKQIQLNTIIQQLNDIFSIVTLLGVCCSVMIMVLYCFMGMNLSSVNDYIQYFFGALAGIMDLLIMCWFSQTIRDCSETLAGSIYNSNWTGTSIMYRKSMILMTQQNQRIISLEAFKFGQLSLEVFSDIMKFSYRLLALLNNVNN